MYIDQRPDARSSSGRRRKDGKKIVVIERQSRCRVANAIPSLSDAYHHRLPPFPAEPQAFHTNFLRYKAAICAFSVSTKNSWGRAKETTR